MMADYSVKRKQRTGGRRDILIVDDEPWYRTIINKELKGAGYTTVLAQNAQEALVALWEKETIGLVLLDVRLPVINGLNIFEIIRKDFPDKKIIVTSVLQKEEQRFLIYDADDYYDKSEELSCLAQKVYNSLSSVPKGACRENEKRNWKRVPANVLASCERDSHYSPDATCRFISYTKDLSPWGGKFIVGEDLKVGQHFTVAMELPVHFLPILIDCEVMWVHRLSSIDAEGRENFEVGIKFLKLDSPRDEEKLKSYLSYV